MSSSSFSSLSSFSTGFTSGAAAASAHLLDAVIPAAQAHEKWFVTETQPAPPLPPAFRFGSAPLTVALTVVAAATVIGFVVDRKFERSMAYARFEARIRRLRDIAPGVLALLTAVSLLWSALQGVILADNVPAPAGFTGLALRLIEAAVGGALLVGFDTGAAAIGLGLLWVSLFALQAPTEPFDYLYFAGIAVFLHAFARGRYSLDWFYGKPLLSSPDGRKRSYLLLQLLAGGGFLALALGKWLRPDLHFALMDAYPGMNPYVVLQTVGLHMTRDIYVLCLATVETVAALFIIGGIFTRFAALLLMPIFLGSILFLGPLELIGHLPIVGALFVLFVYGDLYGKTTEADVRTARTA